ncbi:class I SAM-dependent methyltransferase [Paenibacillus sp. S-12]|uniref:class I SAM-dependent methyltransferase n=1 Tax=Paenibacillus sp. S-12 TaxID=3031371 RepID=UPI0025A04E5F|nr:class I SAM-dependent methyltransferase [Paenibacillus sp. S-12]
MQQNTAFLQLLNDTHKHFSGWDFSFISATGRMQEELLPWSYGSIIIPLIRKSSSALDMGTGGGEFLSKLLPFPPLIAATEGYPPNVPIAKQRLEPLGVKVVEFDDDHKLPLDSASFDLIINKHDSYSPREVRRIIVDSGIFVTQQVGGQDCTEINEMLGVPLNEEYNDWCLQSAVDDLENNGFKIEYSNEAYPAQRFYDIGALVYYLKAIPWQVPNFDIYSYREPLYEIYNRIQTEGFFEVKQHRFILMATVL